ncbi:MAG: leucine-rich repeat protein [Holosporales bacterium]|jgi:hypothetical protein|nr:leucine-rich repeat protein [Holosporales bacterium]
MNISKIGVLATVLWQGAVYTELEAGTNSPIKQLCASIVDQGNMALEYLNGNSLHFIPNAFAVNSNNWQFMQQFDHILGNIVAHQNILPFLRYKYAGNNITRVDLLFNDVVNAPADSANKAFAFFRSAANIAMPKSWKKMPFQIPIADYTLLSFSAAGLKHLGPWGLAGHYDLRTVNLPSAESIGFLAFFSCDKLAFAQFSDKLKFISSDAFQDHPFVMNIPHATHFISWPQSCRLLQISDLLCGPQDDSYYKGGFSWASQHMPGLLGYQDSKHAGMVNRAVVRGGNMSLTLDITCLGRKNILPGLMAKLCLLIGKMFDAATSFAVNIRFDPSIQNIVTTSYIRDILSTNMLTQAEMDEINEEMNQRQDEINNKQAEMDQRQSEIYGKQNELTGDLSQEEIDQLQEEIGQLQEEIDQLQEERDQLQEEITQVQKEYTICLAWRILPVLFENRTSYFLDFRNIALSKSDILSLEIGDFPWVISLPHITTVDASFNSLFQRLQGVIFPDVGSITDGAFTDCQHFTTLGFKDTTTFSGTPLAGLAPLTLELTVTQPKSYANFLDTLWAAGLEFSNVQNFTIKLTDAVAQSDDLGTYVTSLLAACFPSFNLKVASVVDKILNLDLSNSNLADIYDLPVDKFSREYSWIFTLPDGFKHFIIGTQLNYPEETYLIKSVILPEGLEEVPSNAFANYPQLTSVTIPNSVTTIGNHAFYETPLTSVTISNSVTTIGVSAFESVRLTSIIIPDSVTTIGSHAFKYTPLASITIPDSVMTIEDYVFEGCPLQSIKINCNTPSNNGVIAILDKMLNSALFSAANLNTLQVALSPSLLAGKTTADLKDYVQGILNIATDNAIISAIDGKPEKLFELDLSNTDLVQADIEEMTKTLPWTVVFKNGEKVTYDTEIRCAL